MKCLQVTDATALIIIATILDHFVKGASVYTTLTHYSWNINLSCGVSMISIFMILGHDKHTDWRNEFVVHIEEWIYKFWSGLKEWIAILVQNEGKNSFLNLDQKSQFIPSTQTKNRDSFLQSRPKNAIHSSIRAKNRNSFLQSYVRRSPTIKWMK